VSVSCVFRRLPPVFLKRHVRPYVSRVCLGSPRCVLSVVEIWGGSPRCLFTDCLLKQMKVEDSAIEVSSRDSSRDIRYRWQSASEGTRPWDEIV
jgi:hypothetical protein